MARASGLIAGVTLASRLLGFVRWLVFSAAVGAGTVGTAYGTANSVPNVAYEVAVGGALAAVVVPLVGAALAQDRRDDVDTIASTLLTWVVLLLGPLAVVLWALATPVAALLVPADSTNRAAVVDLTATMLRWFAPQVPLYGIGIVAGGVLQAHRRFAAAALAPLLSSLVVVATYVLYGRVRASIVAPGAGAVVLLAAGTTLGVVALSLPLLVPLRRLGVRLRPSLTLPSGTGARVRSLTAAGIVALLAQQVAVLVTIRVANAGHGDGALTVFQYGQAVYLLPYAVLAVPVATAVFPALATGVHVDADAAAPRLAGALRTIAVACGIGGAALVGASGALGRFFAAIDATRHVGGIDIRTAMTALVLALTPGLLGYGLTALLTRALYVRGHPRLASGWVALGWALAALGPLLLAAHEPDPVRRLVVIGAASSLGTTLAAAGLVTTVRSAWPAAALTGLGRSTAAAVVALALGGASGACVDQALAGATTSAPGAAAGGVLAASLALVVAGGVVAVTDRHAVSSLATRLRRAGAGGTRPVR